MSWSNTLRIATFLAGSALLPMVATSAATAETRALVIGIDTYRYLLKQQWLRGAVNDADDIAAALRSRNVRDLTVLTERDATRSKVVPALDALIERTKAGDLVIFTFSGHGVSEVWGKNRPPGVTEGVPHETFLLADVVIPNNKGIVDLGAGGDAADRLPGTELNQKFVRLQAKGARIIFVADACHGGGGTRRFALSEITTRSVVGRPYAEGQDPLAGLYASLPTPVDPDTAIPNLTLLAAVDRYHAVREVAIPKGGDKMRGALSYSFARLIDGTAKLPAGNDLTRRALFDYISATVRPNAANDQDPDLQPRRDPDLVVMKGADFPASGRPAAAAEIRTIRVRTEDGPPVTAAQNVKGAFDIVPVEAGQTAPADLSYVSKSRSVYSATRDLLVDNIAPEALTGVAEREFAVRKLLRMSTSRPLELALDKSDRLYYDGEEVKLQTPDLFLDRNTYYALLNITGGGLIQFVYPLSEKNDSPTLDGRTSFGKLKAATPFGTDMIVLVTSSKPLTKLIAELRRLDDRTPRALDAVTAIEAELDQSSRIGLQGFYSSRSKPR